MATILEGLNKLSGALGGAETATENLEALNAIAGAGRRRDERDEQRGRNRPDRRTRERWRWFF